MSGGLDRSRDGGGNESEGDGSSIEKAGLNPEDLVHSAPSASASDFWLREAISRSGIAGNSEETSDLSPVAPAARSDPSARYRLGKEIARGGMGIVFQGYDVDLGRDLAVKVLLSKHRHRPEYVRRFVDEARICGQLQHPGIVPVYELGELSDRRPFFAMKLVRGRTLAQLLADRPDPASDRPRFLSIFEQVAQTVAYAHSERVIHRDLKPSNVMVGSFGEVQVMDWGLAKILSDSPSPGVKEEGESRTKDKPQENERTAVAAGEERRSAVGDSDSGDESDLSRDGDVMGTPSHMSPEQARGQIDLIDERADVFALGSMLCEILTGRPAHCGKGSRQVQRKAARGDLSDAFARLDASGADAEPIALAKACLAPEREVRPRDAGEAASRFSGYLAGVQEKLRAAEQERAVAAARAVEERQRLRLKIGLAVSVSALAALAIVAAALQFQDRRIRLAKADDLLKQANTDLSLAESLGSEAGAPKLRAAKIALDGAGVWFDSSMTVRLSVLRVRSDKIDRLQHLARALESIRSRRAEDRAHIQADQSYQEAFRSVGLNADQADPKRFAAEFANSPLAVEIASGLDDWATVRLEMAQAVPCATPGLDEWWRRLIAAARATDPDPWRDALRAMRLRPIAEAREALIRLSQNQSALDDQPAPSLVLLAESLKSVGEEPKAAEVLHRAWMRFADDFWVNFALGALSWSGSDETKAGYQRPDEAVRFLTVAAALRPSSYVARNNLGNALDSQGKLDEAIACYRQALELQPDYASAHYNLGIALSHQGRTEDAVASYREAIRFDPSFAAAYANIGHIRRSQGHLEEALAWSERALRLRPDLAAAHTDRVHILVAMGSLEPAVRECREAIQVKPNDPNLHHDLGAVLFAMGKRDEAEAAFRRAIALQPGFSAVECSALAQVLKSQGKLEDALAEYRRVARLEKPGSVHALGAEEEIRDLERRIALKPRLDAVIRGSDRPENARDAWIFMQFCYERGWHSAAVKLGAASLAAEPPAQDRGSDLRYDAACSALLASRGDAKDLATPDDAARAALRSQARDWLVAELSAWSRALGSDQPEARSEAKRKLEHWRVDSDLAGVRDAEGLAKMDAAERERWKALWAEVDRVLVEAQDK